MSGYEVSFSAMRQARSMFQRRHAEMLDVLEDLQSGLERDLHRWEDEARDAYRTAKADWNKAAEQVAMVIREFSAAVGDAHDHYQAAGRASGGVWEVS